MLALHAGGVSHPFICLPARHICAEEEWPDAAETKAARVAEREAKTPVPERCWALRNVAGRSVRGLHVAMPLLCRRAGPLVVCLCCGWTDLRPHADLFCCHLCMMQARCRWVGLASAPGRGSCWSRRCC